MSCCTAARTKEHRARMRECAAMCHTCIYGRDDGDPFGRGNVTCSINGEPVVALCQRGACPKRKHPDETGKARWLGVAWIGVPAPIRWWLRLTHPKHPRSRSWRGCGCVAFLKRLAGGIPT